MQRALEEQGFVAVALWERGIDPDVFVAGEPRRPLFFLCAGRVPREKGTEAFLKLDLPGQKIVAGDGPHLAHLQRRFPDAVYVGRLAQPALARLMAEAAVLVFPSRTDTYGIVMAEASACGTPVAAFPVKGPLDVVRPG
jgi:glycosyltransferase involved in cell wall biosynthesis